MSRPPVVTPRSIEGLSMEQLSALLREVSEHPDNQNRDPRDIYLLTKKAREQSDLIAHAITRKIREKKDAEGVERSIWADAGYSGRQSNRRR